MHPPFHVMCTHVHTQNYHEHNQSMVSYGMWGVPEGLQKDLGDAHQGVQKRSWMPAARDKTEPSPNCWNIVPHLDFLQGRGWVSGVRGKPGWEWRRAARGKGGLAAH